MKTAFNYRFQTLAIYFDSHVKISKDECVECLVNGLSNCSNSGILSDFELSPNNHISGLTITQFGINMLKRQELLDRFVHGVSLTDIWEIVEAEKQGDVEDLNLEYNHMDRSIQKIRKTSWLHRVPFKVDGVET